MLEWHPDGPDRRTTVAKRDGLTFLVHRYKGKYRAMVSGLRETPLSGEIGHGFRTRAEAWVKCENYVEPEA